MAVWIRQEEDVLQLKDMISSSLNPMMCNAKGLNNVITKVVMLPDVRKEEETGQQMYVAFAEEQIGDDFGGTNHQPQNTTAIGCPLPTKKVTA